MNINSSKSGKNDDLSFLNDLAPLTLKSITACLKNNDAAAIAPIAVSNEIGSTTASQHWDSGPYPKDDEPIDDDKPLFPPRPKLPRRLPMLLLYCFDVK